MSRISKLEAIRSNQILTREMRAFGQISVKNN
jgi:hypothetical protein